MSTLVSQTVESVLIGGDLAKLTPEQRVSYYRAVCDSVGLNPLTKPFDYLNLSGKTVLYAKRDATDQLRKIHSVSLKIVGRETINGVYVVTASATDKCSRVDESTGAVAIEGLKGDNLANALMKAETKAKRRVTLSICGLGLLDETEIETIPNAQVGEPAAPPKALPAGGQHEAPKATDTELVNTLEKTLAEAKNRDELRTVGELIRTNKTKLTTAGAEYLRNIYRELDCTLSNAADVNEDAEPVESESERNVAF